MAAPPAVVDNPLSGEQIVISQDTTETGGHLLRWELFLAPGGAVPSRHVHPRQEERFTVVDGQMRFRVGRRSRTVGPGEVVVVPPGTVHHFANAGPRTAHVAVETKPALAMEAMLVTSAALARDQHDRGRLLPHPIDLALFLADFDQEVQAPYLPGPVVRAALRPLLWLATRRNRDARYRRLRDP